MPEGAADEPHQLERDSSERTSVADKMLNRKHLNRGRRHTGQVPNDLTVQSHPDALLFTLSLLKGSYVTTPLQEVMTE